MEIKCDRCGKVFNRRPSKIGINEHQYCSRECTHSEANTHIRISNCLNCGKPLVGDYRAKYCSHSCSAQKNNLYRVVEHSCAFCGNNFKSKGEGQKCCSQVCFQAYIKMQEIERWLRGTWDGCTAKNKELSKRIRDFLLDNCNYKCEKCGWSGINMYSGNTTLQIHHKDGDYQNNIKDNLEVLCPNCHSLTENNGSLNEKGKGRRIRLYK
jgi:hypothetical protein